MSSASDSRGCDHGLDLAVHEPCPWCADVELLRKMGDALAAASGTAFWPEDIEGKSTLRRAISAWKEARDAGS